jgi:hypothetical protein
VPDFHGHRSLRPVTTTGRKATNAEEKRRSRTGDVNPRRGGGLRAVWTETRNGLPDFRPYVYRGTGHDIYEETGE